MLDFDLSQYLTTEAIQRTFETLPPLNTPVMDTFYPDAKKRNHPFPYVSVKDIQTPVRNIAVVKRGSNPTPIYGEDQSIMMIEAQPFKPSERVNAVDINNLKLLNSAAQIQTYVDSKIDRLRQSIRLSTEAMCAQSLGGSIGYPMEIKGGYGTYKIEFESPLSVTKNKAWSDSAITIDSIVGDLVNITTAIKKKSQYGGTGVTFWAGQSAFLALSKIVLARQVNTPNISMTDSMTINLFGNIIKLMADTYVSNIATGGTTPVVADTKLMAVANDAPFELIYAALDNLNANLAGMPIWIDQFRDDRAGSIELIAESKPLPVPYSKGICWMTVL